MAGGTDKPAEQKHVACMGGPKTPAYSFKGEIPTPTSADSDIEFEAMLRDSFCGIVRRAVGATASGSSSAPALHCPERGATAENEPLNTPALQIAAKPPYVNPVPATTKPAKVDVEGSFLPPPQSSLPLSSSPPPLPQLAPSGLPCFDSLDEVALSQECDAAFRALEAAESSRISSAKVLRARNTVALAKGPGSVKPTAAHGAFAVAAPKPAPGKEPARPPSGEAPPALDTLPTIVVDTNHAEDGIFQSLCGVVCGGPFNNGPAARTPHPVVRRQRLDLGDIHLVCPSQRIVVERKELADLAASIKDGRYREQKARMLHAHSHDAPPPAYGDDGDDDNEAGAGSGARPCPATVYMYIVESPRALGWSKTARVGGLPTATLHAAMLKTAIRDGIPVLHSTGLPHTVSLMAYLFGELCKGNLLPSTGPAAAAFTATDYLGTLKKRKRENLADPGLVMAAMLGQIPGMSAAKAAALRGRYANFAALLAATEAELAGVTCGARRLGPAVAKRIFAVLHIQPQGAGGGEEEEQEEEEEKKEAAS